MEAQASHEKSRLQVIERKVKDVQDMLTERLPSQYRHLIALVCSVKWRLRVLQVSPHEAATIMKKTRLELGAFDYRVKEQAELLTRHLIELDDVLSYGDSSIKQARKALVTFVQQLLPQADAFKERSAKLKQFGEDLLNCFVDVPATHSKTSNSDSDSDDHHVKKLFEESEQEMESESEMRDEEKDDEDDEVDEDYKDDEVDDDEDDSMKRLAEIKEVEPMEFAPEIDEEEEFSMPMKCSAAVPVAALQTPEIDVNSLPLWKPYYQLQRREDGVYLIARLHDINPRNVRVQWNENSGVLRIRGFRLPTQKDLVMSRFSGVPTFGRFEIAEQFPRNMLNMDRATQQFFEDGTLQIRVPYYLMQHPLRYRPSSLFQPQDCFVW